MKKIKVFKLEHLCNDLLDKFITLLVLLRLVILEVLKINMVQLVPLLMMD
jgi:hypothetical protein